MTDYMNAGCKDLDAALPNVLTTEADVIINLPTDARMITEGGVRTETDGHLNTEGDGRIDTEMDMITEPGTPAVLLQKVQVK